MTCFIFFYSFAAVNDYRVLPEKCVCMTTCGGKKIAIVLDVEVMKETAHD